MGLKLIISNEVLGISFEECNPTTVDIILEELSVDIITDNTYKNINILLTRDHNALEEWDIITNEI